VLAKLRKAITTLYDILLTFLRHFCGIIKPYACSNGRQQIDNGNESPLST